MHFSKILEALEVVDNPPTLLIT